LEGKEAGRETMTVIVTLNTDAVGRVSAALNREMLAMTALADLPRLPSKPTREDEHPPPTRLMLDPEYEGRPLYAALGGDRLRQALEDDPEGGTRLRRRRTARCSCWR
jgi:hypothetical protein